MNESKLKLLFCPLNYMYFAASSSLRSMDVFFYIQWEKLNMLMLAIINLYFIYIAPAVGVNLYYFMEACPYMLCTYNYSSIYMEL